MENTFVSREEMKWIHQAIASLIETEKFLLDAITQARINDQTIVDILKQKSKDWNYLMKELKKHMEEYEGLYQYVTLNLSKKIEGPKAIPTNKDTKYEFDKIIEESKKNG